MKKFLLSLFVLSLSLKAAVHPAKLDVLDPSKLKWLNTSQQLEVLAEGIGWGEGPVWVAELNALLFSDIANNKVVKWTEQNGLEDYLFPSGHNPDGVNGPWRGANGLLVNHQGELVLAQQGTRQLSVMKSQLQSPTPNFEVQASHYSQRKLNSPNDLVQTHGGDIYFTDPPYGLPKFERDPAIELDFFGVFRLAKTGQLQPVIHSRVKPNGIALSNDEKYLLVSDSEPGIATIFRYELKKNGTLGPEQVFFDASEFERPGKGSTDGLKQHENGFWFVTMPNGIGILSPQGELVGRFQIGQVCNVAIDKEGQFVYFTAPHHLYRLKL